MKNIKFKMMEKYLVVALLFAIGNLNAQNCNYKISSGIDTLDILHLDVGQGDATLILGPKNNIGKRVIVLYDAGDTPKKTKDGGKVVLELLNELKIDTIDYFIISHYHSDHYGGVIANPLIKNKFGTSFILGLDGVPGSIGDNDSDENKKWLNKNSIDVDKLGEGDDIWVNNFIDRGQKYGTKPKGMFKKYLEYAENMGSRKQIINLDNVKNTYIKLGENAYMECVASNGWVKGKSVRVNKITSENEKSIAFLLNFKKFYYYIGGDLNGRKYGSEDAYIEKEVGNYIKTKTDTLDVFQVNHHGGNNCTDSIFLELTKPKAAIISCGDKNNHGHPHKDVLERLIKNNIKIYQTEKGKQKSNRTIPREMEAYQNIANGHILLKSSGEGFSIEY